MIYNKIVARSYKINKSGGNDMKNYVGINIKKVANEKELREGTLNEYGTTDYKIFRNIFDVPADEWVEGISNICLETDENGVITHQIDNI